jgi:small subunit ribosomal protein S20
MPNIKSAQKRMELSRRAQVRNRAARSRLRTAIKRVREADDAETAGPLLQQAYTLLDKAASRNLVHRNKAARIKSSLAKHVKGLEAA